jgi:hypothetical protein
MSPPPCSSPDFVAAQRPTTIGKNKHVQGCKETPESLAGAPHLLANGCGKASMVLVGLGKHSHIRHWQLQRSNALLLSHQACRTGAVSGSNKGGKAGQTGRRAPHQTCLSSERRCCCCCCHYLLNQDALLSADLGEKRVSSPARGHKN